PTAAACWSPTVRQRHPADRGRADGRRRGARPAALWQRSPQPLARLRPRGLAATGGRSARARQSRPRRAPAGDPRQRHGPACDPRRERKCASGRRGRGDLVRRARGRRPAGPAAGHRRGGVQSALRRTSGCRCGAVSPPGRYPAACGAAMAGQPAVRQRRACICHRPACGQEIPAVQWRDRMRVDRLRPDRGAATHPAGGADRAQRRRADGRQPPAQESAEVQEVARTRRHRMLPCLRRRSAGILRRHRCLSASRWRSPRVSACAGIRGAGDDSGSRCAPPSGRTAGRRTRGVRGAGRTRGAQIARARQGRQQVWPLRAAQRVHQRARAWRAAAGESVRLPGHRPVPGSSPVARHHGHAIEGAALPQPVLLHRRGQRGSGGGRRELDHQRGPVRYLSAVVRRQPGLERPGRQQAQAGAGRRAGLAGSRARAFRRDLLRPADLLQLRTRRRLRHPARARAAVARGSGAPGAGWGAVFLQQLPPLQAGRGTGGRVCAVRGNQPAYHRPGFRAACAHPSRLAIDRL
ncbi:hypothetical protein XPN_1766, partial [Xanthomonas arboricola pv. pruni MAFF 301427]